MGAQDDTARPGTPPITGPEFAAWLAPFKLSKTVAVAFSGGPDSLALLLLAAQWARRRRGIRLVAFTVDHGLRAASAGEAKKAARLAQDLKVPHRILKWKDAKPESGIQAAAREARYSLLLDACRDAGAGDLLVAHHLEDQAETFLLRLARGSGVDGLAAMPQTRPLGEGQPAVRLVRPLLRISRTRLLATVEKSGLEPILDPSNEDERFDRVRARKALRFLAPLGLDALRLARTAGHMARARAALEMETAALLRTHAVLSPFGHVDMDAEALASAPSEIGLRGLAAIVRVVCGGDYSPRMEALEAVHAALRDGSLGRGRTLSGVKLGSQAGRLVVTRELAAAERAPGAVLRAGEETLWDGRFHVRLVRARRGSRFEVRALGRAGLSVLQAAGVILPQAPKAALLTLPGLWAGDGLVSAPHLGTLQPGIEAAATLRRTSLMTAGNEAGNL